MKNQPFRERLGFAGEGLATGWRRENSFRTQTRIAAVSLVALLVLRPAPVWWGLVAVTVALVLTISLAALVVGVPMIADAGPARLAEWGWWR